MLKKKLKTSNPNHWKKNAVYVLLLISNIILCIGLIDYYSKVGVSIHITHFEEIAAVIAAICILGFISLRLPKIKDLGEHYIYGISYILIICAIGLMTSYFDEKIDASVIFGPYLEMFKILCAVLIFILLATNLKAFKELLDGKFSRKNVLICLAIFIAVGLFASYAHIDVDGLPANIRCIVVMISGLFGGPFLGIPVGIISGAYRYTLGGATALPCAISTVISGIIGSLIFIWNDMKFPGIIESIVLMSLFTGFEMLMIVLLTPPDISFPFVRNVYPIMLFASIIGMLLFSIVIQEARAKMTPETSYEEQKIMEFEEKFKKQFANNEELRGEIEKLKGEIEELKKK